METNLQIRDTSIYWVFAISLLFLITGCEGMQISKGNVVDADTKVPLDSVAYIDLKDPQKAVYYTDLEGQFDITGNFGGCLPDCPELVVRFSKPGYESQTITNPGVTHIYLEKIKNEK